MRSWRFKVFSIYFVILWNNLLKPWLDSIWIWVLIWSCRRNSLLLFFHSSYVFIISDNLLLLYSTIPQIHSHSNSHLQNSLLELLHFVIIDRQMLLSFTLGHLMLVSWWISWTWMRSCLDVAIFIKSSYNFTCRWPWLYKVLSIWLFNHAHYDWSGFSSCTFLFWRLIIIFWFLGGFSSFNDSKLFFNLVIIIGKIEFVNLLNFGLMRWRISKSFRTWIGRTNLLWWFVLTM